MTAHLTVSINPTPRVGSTIFIRDKRRPLLAENKGGGVLLKAMQEILTEK